MSGNEHNQYRYPVTLGFLLQKHKASLFRKIFDLYVRTGQSPSEPFGIAPGPSELEDY